MDKATRDYICCRQISNEAWSSRRRLDTSRESLVSLCCRILNHCYAGRFRIVDSERTIIS